MRLLFGTGNKAKLDVMRRRLEGLQIEIIGLHDMMMGAPEVLETGRSPLENARQKAHAYYKAFGVPVFSCDSGMYIDEIPDDIQPGVHVRTVNGTYLSDEEMMAYYSGLARKYGNLTATYKNAICLILDTDHIYESMDESLESKRFILTEKPHPIVKPGFPLDSLSLELVSGKYYYDLEESELDQVAVEEGFLRFFETCLFENTKIEAEMRKS